MSARSLLILSLLAAPAAAAPTLDPQYGDHAVVQRGKPLILSGSATPGEQLSVTFAGSKATTTTDASGRWSVSLPARAGGGPFKINVTGANGASAASEDVAIGDVWLCSGQSNMEFPLRHALSGEDEVQAGRRPQSAPPESAAAAGSCTAGDLRQAAVVAHGDAGLSQGLLRRLLLYGARIARVAEGADRRNRTMLGAEPRSEHG